MKDLEIGSQWRHYTGKFIIELTHQYKGVDHRGCNFTDYRIRYIKGGSPHNTRWWSKSHILKYYSLCPQSSENHTVNFIQISNKKT